MKLSMQWKAYFLIILNIVCIFALFLWFSDIKVAKQKSECVEIGLQPVKLIIIDHRAKFDISFIKNENEEWMLNLGDAHCHANEHAIDKILYNLSKILSEKDSDARILLHDPLWSIIIVDNTGDAMRFDVSENGTKISRAGKTSYSHSTDLQKYLFQNKKNFVDERLWAWSVKEVRFFKLQSMGTILAFSKKNDSWHMELPFSRPMFNTIVGDALKFLCAIHCHSLINDQEPFTPDLSVTIGSSDHQVYFDLLHNDGKFFVKKNELIFDVPAEFEASLNNLLENSLNLHIFDNLRIDSLELQKSADERAIVVQKLGETGKWQTSLQDDRSMNFVEVDGDKIQSLKKFLFELSLQERAEFKISDESPRYKLRLYSDIGGLNFQIFDATQGYVLLHEESGIIFDISNEFVENLQNIIDICEQDDDRDFSGTGS